ncbi:TAXI family TRAP transporter solute-binding subunit [Indioceanicola profundi]|uniref:TAXI family TRAP transporter solute-binding subunit n=1 Tax=Indioceanicola profundi TaxID=2220096 RepID=UPI000E6ABF6D|nr:TAXI family TRAP transporter solute-binding subunit [Indioceanicola profundi]
MGPIAWLRRVQDNSLVQAVILYLLMAGIVLAGLLVAWRFVDPAPPDGFRLAAGERGGFYWQLGEQFAEAFARVGVEVEVLETAGSVENLSLLQSGRADAAFVQGGAAQTLGLEDVRGVASLAVEPIWIFSRGAPVDRLADLAGKRIAMGPQGSGIRLLSTTLLKAAGVLERVEPVELSGMAAARALLAGEVDAAILVTTAQATSVRTLMAAPDVELADLDRGPAITRLFPYLTQVSLPEGSLNLAADLPKRDVTLVATTTAMLVGKTMHSAFVSQALIEARDMFGRQWSYGAMGRFPSPDNLDVPLRAEAERFFSEGPNIARRWLPFWAANYAERLWVLLIPLLTLMLPLMRLAPPIYEWQVRRRIYRWYKEARRIEDLLDSRPTVPQLRAALAQLDMVQNRVGHTRVPLSYSESLYQLRLHLEYVRRRLRERLTELTPPETEQAAE